MGRRDKKRIPKHQHRNEDSPPKRKRERQHVYHRRHSDSSLPSSQQRFRERKIEYEESPPPRRLSPHQEESLPPLHYRYRNSRPHHLEESHQPGLTPRSRPHEEHQPGLTPRSRPYHHDERQPGLVPSQPYRGNGIQHQPYRGNVPRFHQPREHRSKSSSSVSLILRVNSNVVLSQANNYDINFGVGMMEGEGIVVDSSGRYLTFEKEGSYRFELIGEATPFSNTPVKVVFHGNFSADIKDFTESPVITEEGKITIRGAITILPIKAGQVVTVRLVPEVDESIVILMGARLIIQRV